MQYKFGKQPFLPDTRDFLFSTYLNKAVLPPHPPTFGHENSVPSNAWGMLGNDTVGDCAVAGPMHQIVEWTTAAKKPVSFTTANAIGAYSAISGYTPSNPNTDVGCQLRDVLKYWQKTGFKDTKGNLHKIAAYLQIPISQLANIEEAIYLFGSVTAGLMVPKSMMDQFNAGQPLTVVQHSPIEGGHCMPLIGLESAWIPASTWGSIAKVTVPFFKKYYDEVWAVISQDELDGKGMSPEAFNWTQLQADLKAI